MFMMALFAPDLTQNPLRQYSITACEGDRLLADHDWFAPTHQFPRLRTFAVAGF